MPPSTRPQSASCAHMGPTTRSMGRLVTGGKTLRHLRIPSVLTTTTTPQRSVLRNATNTTEASTSSASATAQKRASPHHSILTPAAKKRRVSRSKSSSSTPKPKEIEVIDLTADDEPEPSSEERTSRSNREGSSAAVAPARRLIPGTRKRTRAILTPEDSHRPRRMGFATRRPHIVVYDDLPIPNRQQRR